MEKKKYSNPYPSIAGILFAICAIDSLLYLILGGQFSVSSILSMIGAVTISFALITKRRDIVLPIGFAVRTLLSLSALSGRIPAVPLLVSSVVNILFVISFVGITMICFVELTEYVPQMKGKLRRFWNVPGILYTITYIVQTILLARSTTNASVINIISNILLSILFIIGLFLAAHWACYPKKRKKAPITSNGTVTGINNEAYCGIVKHILLLLFTCGIWLLIWIHRMTRYTNAVRDEEPRNPTNKLLLCMFIPFYQIYWTYKTAQRIDKMAKRRGLQSDLSTLCLILEFFVPIIPPVLMQDKMNEIVTTRHQTTTSQTQARASVPTGTADELKKYKELLDSGIITQEEFNAKKKQLLGL